MRCAPAFARQGLFDFAMAGFGYQVLKTTSNLKLLSQ